MNNLLARHISFTIGIGLFVVLVGFTVFTNEQIITTGDTTILATRPVDPRDLFRGDYVILRYAIERDPKVTSFIQTTALRDGDTLYVQLGEDAKGIAYVADVSVTPPVNPNETWILGEVERDSVRFSNIEQYYVPEGTGKSIEQLGTNVFVEVSTYRGQVRIFQLLDASLKPLDTRKLHIIR